MEEWGWAPYVGQQRARVGVVPVGGHEVGAGTEASVDSEDEGEGGGVGEEEELVEGGGGQGV